MAKVPASNNAANKELFPGADGLAESIKNMFENIQNAIKPKDFEKFQASLKTAFDAGVDAASKGFKEAGDKIGTLNKN